MLPRVGTLPLFLENCDISFQFENHRYVSVAIFYLREKEEVSLLNVSTMLKKGEQFLKNTGSKSPRLDAEVLLAKCLGAGHAQLYAHPERRLTADEEALFSSSLRRRAEGEPIAYIVGEKEFWSIPLAVTRNVLIPRPDTEAVVEAVIEIARTGLLRKQRILEIGTGSGAIAIALASELPEASIFAADIAEGALKTAVRNAAASGSGQNISFLCSNLFAPLKAKFDIVVSNPPYITEEEFLSLPREIRRYEPKGALVAGPKGTEFHEALIRGSLSVLASGGWLVMEIGDGQKKAVEDLFAESGEYEPVRFRRDYSGACRVAAGRRRR